MQILLIIIIIFMFLIPIAILIFEALPLLFGAPFEPTKDKDISSILRLLRSKKGKKVADLGSGDGRIVIELAKHGFKACGYEINPFLYLYSKYKIRRLGLQKQAKIFYKSFWYADFSEYDFLVVFQINYVMPALELKVRRELKPGSLIASNKWTFPHLKPKKKLGQVNLYKI